MAGIGCLYSGEANVNTASTDLESITKGLQYYNEKVQFVYALAASALFAVSQVVMQRTKPFIHHSIDTIYISLALTLVTPSFVLSDYSMYPTKFSVSGNELTYYVIGGILAWFFHSQMTQVLCQPKETVSNPELGLHTLTVAFITACIFDWQVYDLKLAGLQAGAACLLIVPAVLYDVAAFCQRQG